MRLIINFMRNIKAKYNRIIESQIISNLNIEAVVAQTKYDAELFYIGEIKNHAIRRGFYNVLHRLFVIENNSAKDIKVRYTLLKVARALYAQNSVKHAAELLDRLGASSVERSNATAAVKNKVNSRTDNIVSMALMARVVACMDAWAIEALHRQNVRPAGINADAPYNHSFRERRATFVALFATWVKRAYVAIKPQDKLRTSTSLRLEREFV